MAACGAPDGDLREHVRSNALDRFIKLVDKGVAPTYNHLMELFLCLVLDPLFKSTVNLVEILATIRDNTATALQTREVIIAISTALGAIDQLRASQFDAIMARQETYPSISGAGDPQ
jgi:hypothetical protein